MWGNLGPPLSLHFLTPPIGQPARISKETEDKGKLGREGNFFQM